MLIVFDWDGTLADSRNHIVAAMQCAIDELSLPAASEDECASKIGLSLIGAAQSLFPGLDTDGANKFCEVYSRHFLELGQEAYRLELFHGVAETLETLADRGYPMAVATGKSRRGLERVLGETGLKDAFVATRTADETASKPNPRMLLELLEQTGKGTHEAVMVGDTSYDLEMAQRAGVTGIGVSYGVHNENELSRYQPVAILDKLPELLDWLSAG